MCIIDRFFEEAPPGKSPWTKENVLSLIFFSPDEITKINICHMIAKEHPEVIEGTRWLINVDIIDSDQASEDYAIDHDDADLYEEDASGLLGAVVTEEVGDMQKDLKSSSMF